MNPYPPQHLSYVRLWLRDAHIRCTPTILFAYFHRFLPSRTKDTVRRSLLGASFCSESGSLARATPLFLCGLLPFSAVQNFAMRTSNVATLPAPKTKRPKRVFSSGTYRVTRPSSPNPIVKMGMPRLPCLWSQVDL